MTASLYHTEINSVQLFESGISVLSSIICFDKGILIEPCSFSL